MVDGIALDDSLMQQDGIHPNAAAQPRLLAQVWPKLEPLLAPGETKPSERKHGQDGYEGTSPAIHTVHRAV